MASRQATKRLQKEFKAIQASPPPYIIAKPNDENILEWHYVITGPEGTPYEGGQFHGILRFPTDYPFKPPAISIITPNGRFSTNTRLCLSMSDYHPDTWNPAWSVSTILTGLLSFMTGTESTTGSILTTDSVKKKLAGDSKRWNNQENPRFMRIFGDLVAKNRIDIAKAEEEKLKLNAGNNNNNNNDQDNGGQKTEIDLSKLDPEERARLANAANPERQCIIM